MKEEDEVEEEEKEDGMGEVKMGRFVSVWKRFFFIYSELKVY